MKICLVTKLPDEVQAVIDQQNKEASKSLQNASQVNNIVQAEKVHVDDKQIQQ